jgi:hypothetical protein
MKPDALSLVNQHGLTLVMRRVTVTPGGCWEYKPPASTRGRPRVTIKGVNMAAYEYVWLCHTRQLVPEGMMLLHSCGNGDKGCVNPKHLRIGTPSENNADTLEHGTHRNQNTGKDTCVRGHPFDEHNTRIRSDGRRACRACERERRRRT